MDNGTLEHSFIIRNWSRGVFPFFGVLRGPLTLVFNESSFKKRSGILKVLHIGGYFVPVQLTLKSRRWIWIEDFGFRQFKV